MDVDYSKREIDSKFDAVHHRFDDVKSDLSSILTQTTKTNGRVNALENWRWFLVGGMAIVSSFVIPLILYIWSESKTFDDKIVESIEKVLPTYEIQVK